MISPGLSWRALGTVGMIRVFRFSDRDITESWNSGFSCVLLARSWKCRNNSCIPTFTTFPTFLETSGFSWVLLARSWECRNNSCIPDFRPRHHRKPENLVYSDVSDMIHPTRPEHLVYSDFSDFYDFYDFSGH